MSAQWLSPRLRTYRWMLSLLTMSQAGQYCWPIQAPDKAHVLPLYRRAMC